MKKLLFFMLLLGGLQANAQDFKKHIEFLASEQCGGRTLETKGDTLAARYIIEQYKTIDGLTLLGEEGVQTFYFGGARETAVANTFMTINGKKTTVGKDFVVLPISESGNYEGETVYLKEFSVDRSNPNAFEGMDLKGKMVVLDAEVGDNQEFMMMLYFGARMLSRAGATGLIFVSPQVNAEYTSSRAMGGEMVFVNVNTATGERLKKGAKVVVKTQVDLTTKGQRAGRNLVAKISATPENNPNGECIVIGAHYDHLGYRTRDGQTLMYPGADDNASGTATIIELARYIAPLRDVMRRDVYIVAFGCEEVGLRGSFHYAQNPLEPLDHARAMLNFDMVGRMSDYNLDVEAMSSWALWPSFLASVPNKDRLNIVWLNRAPGGTDYAGFAQRGIPSLSFCTGIHPDYHKPTDTADKINYDGMKMMFDYVTNIVDRLILLNF